MEMYAINQYYKNFDDLESIKSRQTEAERRNCVRHVLVGICNNCYTNKCESIFLVLFL